MSKVRVMVVDDTITYRQIMSSVVNLLPNAEMVGTAASGQTALMKLKSLKPHLVFLDVMMPEMDGIETLRRIKSLEPEVQVVMVSGFDMANAKATLESLEDGALDFVPKPTAENIQDGIEKLRRSLEPLVDVVLNKIGSGGAESIDVSTEVPPPPPTPIKTKPAKSDIGVIDFVLIGISTGGPNALQRLFESIKVKISCPILIVQHMPPMFTKSLAERLNTKSPMEIVEAQDHEIPENGKVYIAPGGMHMVVRGKPTGEHEIRIIDSAPVNHCKPAVDILFRSVSGLKGVRHISVIMTGMGRDGTDGLKSLKRKETYCLIQDEESSVVWGMPGSAYNESLVDEVLPLEKIGKRIIELTHS